MHIRTRSCFHYCSYSVHTRVHAVIKLYRSDHHHYHYFQAGEAAAALDCDEAENENSRGGNEDGIGAYTMCCADGAGVASSCCVCSYP